MNELAQSIGRTRQNVAQPLSDSHFSSPSISSMGNVRSIRCSDSHSQSSVKVYSTEQNDHLAVLDFSNFVGSKKTEYLPSLKTPRFYCETVHT